MFAILLNAEAHQLALDDVEGGEVGLAGGAWLGEPAAELARLVERLNAARARQRQRDERVRRAVRHQRRLQGRLLAQVEDDEKGYLHKAERGVFLTPSQSGSSACRRCRSGTLRPRSLQSPSGWSGGQRRTVRGAWRAKSGATRRARRRVRVGRARRARRAPR